MSPVSGGSFRVPEAWTGPFHPLVGLHGLHVEADSVDRRVWELLNLQQHQQQMRQPTDLTPTYTLSPLPLPRKKDKGAMTDMGNYVPKGIFPTNWAEKHRHKVPAVLVAFFKEVPVQEVVETLGKLREEGGAHGSQLLVMLVKGPGDEELSTEKASALCAAAEITPKSLFVLVTSHPDRIHSSVMRMEKGIREACAAYYAGRIRRLKSNKEKTHQPILHARYNLKLAVFFEIRKDFTAALSQYEAALDGVTRLGVALHEVRVLSSIITYRIGRLHLFRKEWSEAKAKFQKVVTAFKSVQSNPALGFEKAEFFECLYHNFGELSKQYYTPESNNAVDPVGYFLVAARYAQERAEMVSTFDKSSVAEQVGNEFESWSPKYIGERPWSYNDEDMKLAVLRREEATVPHSELVINHLGVASEFCKGIRRLRTSCQLMSIMGTEFLRNGDYSRCILLMSHVLREFGTERWLTLLLHSAQVGLQASTKAGDPAAYMNFLVVLLKRDLRSMLKAEEVQQFSSNLETVINRKTPEHEGLDKESFSRALSSEGDIKSYVGVHSEPLLMACIGFADETISIHRTTRVMFRLKNRHDRPVFIKSVSIQTNMPEYDVTKGVGVELPTGANYEAFIDITPSSKEANKVIQLQVGIVDIGRESVFVLLHYSLIHKSIPTLWNEWDEEKRMPNVLRVEGSKSLLQCQVFREEPAFVGEAHRVTFSWKNTDAEPATKLVFTFFLSTTNPQLVRLSANPDSLLEPDGGGLSYTVEHDELSAGAAYDCTLYLRVSGETELKLISKVKYLDSFNQPVGTDHFVPISVIAPFSIITSVQDIQGEALTHPSCFQPFICSHTITNITSKASLCIHKITFKSNNRNVLQHGAGAGSEDIVLGPSETISAIQMLQLLEDYSGDTDNFVSLQINWSRVVEGTETRPVIFDHDVPFPAVETVEQQQGLYLTGEFGEGWLKCPMTVTYTLFNRSSQTHDLVISIDSTEYFMNAGPKRVSLKLNSNDHFQLSFILFPLKTGLVTAPRLLLEGADASQIPSVYRDHTKSIFIRRKGPSQTQNETPPPVE